MEESEPLIKVIHSIKLFVNCCGSNKPSTLLMVSWDGISFGNNKYCFNNPNQEFPRFNH